MNSERRSAPTAIDKLHRERTSKAISRASRSATVGGLCRAAPLVAALVFASPAHAELRDFCPTRPGLNTPSCTVDTGHVIVEVGLADWTLERQADTRTDTIEFGQALVRYGIDERTEVQLGWTLYGRVRTRANGIVDVGSGPGDLVLAVKRGLAGDNGPVAVQAYVTLPVGSSAIGAGDWQAGLLVPLELEVSERLTLVATPQVDLLANADRPGHHLGYGSAFGGTIATSTTTSLALEGSVTRDDDVHDTQSLASLSFAWQPSKNSQFDLGAVKAIANAADIETYVGFSVRF